MNDVTLPDGRTMSADDFEKAIELLTKPFPPEQIEKLPKQLKSGKDQPRYQCRAGTQASADGHHCGGYHGRAIHLDYVGHATITERLNAVDPFWTIDFMVKHPETGDPKISADGTWFQMTVLGVTRPCVGDTGGKALNGNGMKELYGDAIRNGAMRFGVGTYLWSKSEEAERRKLGEVEMQDPPHDETPPQPGPDWKGHYAAAKEQGPDALRKFLAWARQHDGPAPMIEAGEKFLTEHTPIEGEVVQ